MIFIGLDDTDTLETRGTGHLAREIAVRLAAEYTLLGVTRHQLLLDPRVPCTKNNSSAAIAIAADGDVDLPALFQQVRDWMEEVCPPGSDPGLCVARDVPAAIADWGRRVQRELVVQAQARALAAAHNLLLAGLGGDEGGVIGALAAVGLAASGEDGRYVLIGRMRELSGLQPVPVLLAAGIAAVETIDGEPVCQGLVLADRLRPARRGGRPVAVVEPAQDAQGSYWLPLKLD